MDGVEEGGRQERDGRRLGERQGLKDARRKREIE